ncbi:related to integral membrane protein [Fusarium torulosum]|uniref:Related to integral membrane protein n=1 Tax=Fusarium torulosum TaxID=33205 RepID=A0AAE8MIA8_9HYPO|nr:related to integral membrane protein [Fusarium torulosum]
MDYRPNLYAAICITLPLAALVLVLRLLARRTTRAGYGIDDWLAVVAFIGALGYSVDNLVFAIGFGLGRPLENGPSHLTEDERLERSYLLIWLSSLTYTIAIAGAKFAILAFYWRLFRYSNTRIAIQIVAILCGIWLLVRLFLLTLQCLPTSAYWDIARRATHCHVNNTIYFFSTGLTHAVLDVIILTLPIIEVAKMHLPLGQKIAVIALFGFGTLVCVFTILVIQDAFKFDGSSREVALRMAKHGALASAECNLANVSVSLPMLRPVFRRIIPSSFLASHRSKRAVIDSVLAPSYGIKNSRGTKTSQPTGSSSLCEFAVTDDIPPGYDIEASHAGWSYGTEISIFSPFRNQKPPETVNEGMDGIQIEEETTVHIQQLG